MTGTCTRIVVVDDEPAIRRLLRMSLTSHGYEVIEAATGRAGMASIENEAADLMVLDLGLPDMDGLEVVRQIRSVSAVPIIILSIRSNDREKVAALDAGADDYVTKPFSTEELLARVRTALRHALQERGIEPVFIHDDLCIDLVQRRVSLSGTPVRLSPKEYEILSYLTRHAGRVVTHHQLLDAVWGGAGDIQYLRVYLRQLRQKVEPDPAQPRYLITESGVGYRLLTKE